MSCAEDDKLEILLEHMGRGIMPRREVEALAGALSPANAVRLLEAAAENMTGTSIEELFARFGSFEFTASALCRAISCGNAGAAIALAGRGASLDPSLKEVDRSSYPVDTDFSEGAVRERLSRYLRENLSEKTMFHDPGTGRFATRCEADVSGIVYKLALKPNPRLERGELRGRTSPAKVVEDLADRCLLDSRDLLGLCIASALSGDAPLSSKLAELVPADHPPVAVEAFVPGTRDRIIITEAFELLYPGCSIECAQVACSQPSRKVLERWTPALLDCNPAVARLAIRKMRPREGDSIAGTGRILAFLARHGYLHEMMHVSGWPSPLSEDAFSAGCMTEAIKAATDGGHPDAASWLLSERARRHGSGDLVDLKL